MFDGAGEATQIAAQRNKIENKNKNMKGDVIKQKQGLRRWYGTVSSKYVEVRDGKNKHLK